VAAPSAGTIAVIATPEPGARSLGFAALVGLVACVRGFRHSSMEENRNEN
jgi:hypothetical protein